MKEEEKDDGIKISMPLISNLELQQINNNMGSIVEQFTKAFIHDKELAIAQHIIETQKAEIDAKEFDIEALKEERENDINKIDKLQAETEKKDKRISDLEFALMDMVLQFADEDKEQINTMGLSALEIAFTELDLYDPIDRKEVEKKYAELAAKYYGLAEEEK